MLSRLQYLVEGFIGSSAHIFEKAGLSPNWVTVLGFFFAVLASLFYSTGLSSQWLWTGSVGSLAVAGYFDALDGTMARRYRKVSKVGGILDSVLDRIGEIALYASLAFGGLVDFALSLWALSASLMVSYVRARVQAEGIALKGIGLAERPERLLILLASTLLMPFYRNSIVAGVFLVALLASLTVVERVYKASKMLSGKS